jgi:lipocalin
MLGLKTIGLLLFCLAVVLLAAACLTPKAKRTGDLPAVKDVDLSRYAGTWYEIARLPNRFEKGLSRITATYTLGPGNKITVLNEGIKEGAEGEKSSIRGRAWVPDPAEPGRLKVSFFLFFSSDYKIIALDSAEYQYAMVTSSSRDYLWILSRTPVMQQAVYDSLVAQAAQWRFVTQKLTRVVQ